MADLTLGDTDVILDECRRQGLRRNQVAYVLATAYWETAHTMMPVREAFWLSELWRKDNLRYYPWYGRGYVQLTWRTNYEKMGKRLGTDLLTEPDVVMEPSISAKILVIGMMDGLFTGKKLPDYVNENSSNYRGARRVVNGTDKASAISELAEEYEAALNAIGFGLERNVPVANEQKDGTQPRESVTRSKTIQSQIVQTVGTSGMGVVAFLQTQDDATKMVIAAVTCVALIAGAIVFKERLRKWANGDR